jgi:hypothetical protein
MDFIPVDFVLLTRNWNVASVSSFICFKTEVKCSVVWVRNLVFHITRADSFRKEGVGENVGQNCIMKNIMIICAPHQILLE